MVTDRGRYLFNLVTQGLPFIHMDFLVRFHALTGNMAAGPKNKHCKRPRRELRGACDLGLDFLSSISTTFY